MLQKTKEYETFGNFVEDSGGNAIRVPAGKDNSSKNKVCQNSDEKEGDD
jgi:hypothetical protein